MVTGRFHGKISTKLLSSAEAQAPSPPGSSQPGGWLFLLHAVLGCQLHSQVVLSGAPQEPRFAGRISS
jgi:hypothetical protein